MTEVTENLYEVSVTPDQKITVVHDQIYEVSVSEDLTKIAIDETSYQIDITTQQNNVLVQENIYEILISESPAIPIHKDETFETVSKNLRSWDYTLNYSAGILNSIVYSNEASVVTKTLVYNTGLLTTVTLSGDIPSGISLTKTLTYDAGSLIGVEYS